MTIDNMPTHLKYDITSYQSPVSGYADAGNPTVLVHSFSDGFLDRQSSAYTHTLCPSKSTSCPHPAAQTRRPTRTRTRTPLQATAGSTKACA